MSIGLAEAARRSRFRLEIPLALDSDEAAIQIYKANMPGADARVGDVAACFDGESGAPLTFIERKTQESVGKVDVLLGGPPCQGHSDLNNHTRRNDPKNALYLLMARAATVLQPNVVVVENVAPVQRDKSGVVQATAAALTQAGYTVAGRVLDLRRVGVPQRRRRYVMLATAVPEVAASKILESLAKGLHQHPDRSVHWAIADLAGLETKTTYDTASRANEENRRRIDYLFGHDAYDLPNSERPECHRDRDHSYVSMYGRLRWNAPAQTITTGFGSMGQGRYVHPAERRTLTPHEAARLQTFPDWFSFGEKSPRSVLAKMIGNAVPPLLMIELGSRILAGLATAAAVRQRKHA
jgi:DNA (cytosine-5)-methyltransferase 1